MTTTFERIHERIEMWFREALQVVEPRAAARRVLGWDGEALTVSGKQVPVAPDARLVVLAIGKAAPAMARGAVDVLGDRISRGIVLTKDGHLDGDIGGFDLFEASHPIPDERGVAATEEIIRAVEGFSADDVVLALISGGGSALLELPRDPLTLEDMRRTTERLMHAGAGIHDLNTVRSVLSEVKGGGLRRTIGDARCVSLMLSDVLGNDPRVIASGPTIRNSLSTAAAAEVIQRFNLQDSLPAPVRDVLSRPDEPLELPSTDCDVQDVIADNETLVSELRRLVDRDGFSVGVQWRGYDGDAEELGRLLVDDTMQANAGIEVLLGGGEATVEVTGSGSGGRNTEAALAAALALQDSGEWVVASLASDGDDGSANAAGAIADLTSIGRGMDQGIDARDFLANNDSATYFRRAGGLVVTGPTGTNVNDVYIAVRASRKDDQGQDACAHTH